MARLASLCRVGSESKRFVTWNDAGFSAGRPRRSPYTAGDFPHCWGLYVGYRASLVGLVGLYLCTMAGFYRPGVFWQRAEALTRTLTACGRPWLLSIVIWTTSSTSMIRRAIGPGMPSCGHLGHCSKRMVVNEDIIGRLGGEEFGWVLSGCTTEEAVNAANRVLTAFQAASCNGLAVTCAFSPGVAGWQVNGPMSESV